MKGVIFNLLEETVTSRWGEGTWEELLDSCGLDGVFTSLGSYPDEQFVALVEAAAKQTGEGAFDLLRWFGRAAMPHLAESYPEFFSRHEDLGTFLLTLNDIIHTEVRKLYPEAQVPVFSFDAPEEGHLRIEYRSARKMCALAEGFIEGAADHFYQAVTIEQPECMLRGDDRCLLDTTYRAA